MIQILSKGKDISCEIKFLLLLNSFDKRMILSLLYLIEQKTIIKRIDFILTNCFNIIHLFWSTVKQNKKMQKLGEVNCKIDQTLLCIVPVPCFVGVFCPLLA